MKSINTYYTSKEQLESFILDEKIENTSSLLIQVFSALTDKNFISTLLSELSLFLPNAVIIGSTTDGEIMNGKVSSGKVVLSFTLFENTTLKAAAIEHKVNGFFSGQYLAKELISEESKLFIAFVDGLHTNGEEFLSGIASVNDSVMVAGGHAADNGHFQDTLVFTKDHIFNKGAVAVTLNNKNLNVHTDYSFNWHPIGNELTITKAEGNRIYTIDGRSAVDTYAYYLGEDIAKGLPVIGMEFPLIVNRNGLDVSRACITKEDDGSLIVGGNIYTGEKVRIGYGDSKEILQKSHKIIESTAEKPSEVIFIYSCATRKYFMGDEIESETLPLQHIAPVSGFFTYGEFFTSKKNELFNQTMTLVSLSESNDIRTITDNTKVKKNKSESVTQNALAHLLNMSSKEVQEETTKVSQYNHERMELAILGTNEGVWDWNILDNTVYFSARWKEILGYKDDELPNELSTWEDNVHPDDLDKTWEDVYKNVNGETKFYENLHRLKHKEGHWVWILDRGKTQYDANGKAIRMIGTHLDMTQEMDKKDSHIQQTDASTINSKSIGGLTHLINITSEKVIEQTQTLIESDKLNQALKERMELALIGSKTSVLDWNFATNDFYISPSWKEMLGYNDDELENTTYTWQHRVHPDDRKNIVDQLKTTQAKHLKYFENTHRLKHKDGHWIWVLGRAQIMYDENGKKVRMVGTHTDITKEKELQLKYSHQAQMLNQMHETVNTTDLKGYITFWNKGSELTYGYKAEEVIGKHISMIYSPEVYETFIKNIPKLMEEGEFHTTIPLIKKSNETVLISLSLSLLRDDKGIPVEIVSYGQDVTESKKVQDELYEQKNILRYQAHYDILTGLPNRILFTDRLTQTIKTAKRHKAGFALFFIDLDKFKNINDSLGHDVGDKVLKAVGKRLKNHIRKEDTLARLSGDEFTLIMDDLHQPKDASLLAEKILKALAEPMYIDENTLYVTGSIGISLYPQDATDAQYLLKYADTAMYKAKEEGRNNIQFYSSEMTKRALEHMLLKTALQQAIDNHEFVIHYQPQINTLDNTLVGVEALVRWQHPQRGFLYPDAFIPLAEETGLIVKIDQWVMKTAMKQIAKWYKEGLNPGLLAVNLSIKQLECSDFTPKIIKRIEKYHFNAEWLELEITEGQMMKKPEEMIEKLTQINDLGISISIDDFGTGYSSLSLLKRLPINRLKIDRSFVRDVPDDDEDVAIVKAIIALAESLKLDIIAEGVETSEQKEFLMANHCTNVQGYYYYQPLSVDEMKSVLLKEKH